MKLTSADLRRALAEKGKAKKKGTWHGFSALVGQLRGKGVRDPKGLAATIGRSKFGKKNFAAMGMAGKKGMSKD